MTWVTMRNELHHITVAAAAAVASQASVRKLGSSSDLRLQVLCKMLSTVYGSRFTSAEDQAAVQKLIAQELDVTEADLKAESEVTMQTDVPATLRIGAVYLQKGAAAAEVLVGCQLGSPAHKVSAA